MQDPRTRRRTRPSTRHPAARSCRHRARRYQEGPAVGLAVATNARIRSTSPPARPDPWLGGHRLAVRRAAGCGWLPWALGLTLDLCGPNQQSERLPHGRQEWTTRRQGRPHEGESDTVYAHVFAWQRALAERHRASGRRPEIDASPLKSAWAWPRGRGEIASRRWHAQYRNVQRGARGHPAATAIGGEVWR